MRFVLFPMLHVGAPSFYADVTRRLSTCDLVVAEGIRGTSLRTSALTLTYRLFSVARRAGLVVQDIDYKSLGVPVVAPDMSGSEFGAGWRRLPLTLRLWVWALVPVYALGMLVFGSRALLARHAEVDDLPSREDVEMAANERIAPFSRLLVDDRDAHLVAALDRIHGERCSEAIQVAIVYGASHMPAVVRHLKRFGYWVRDAEWMTVFDLAGQLDSARATRRISRAASSQPASVSAPGHVRRPRPGRAPSPTRQGAPSVPDEREAQALCEKGAALAEIGRWQEEIAVYDELDGIFGHRSDLSIRRLVATALVRKGYRLNALGLGEEAIAVDDVVESRFSGAPQAAIRELVAMALVNKAVALRP